MNVRRASGEGDKVSLSPPSHSREDANVAYPAKSGHQQATTRGPESFLSAPPAGPVRPLSPDALSILSTEDFEQIRLIRRPSRTSQADHGLPKDQSLRARFRASWFRNKGIFLMVLAQFFGVLMNVTTRILEVEGNHGNGLHPFQILFARMGITALLAMAYMHCAKTPHFPFGAPEVRWLLVARGFFGFFGVFGMYYSLLYLPLADAVVITFLAPGLSCWVCSKLINEPFTRAEMIGTFVSLVGVLFIAHPASLFNAIRNAADEPPAGSPGDASPSQPDAGDYDNVTPIQRLAGVGVALVGVCGATGAFTTIRWIGKRAHPLISVNYFAVWCTLISIVMQLALPSIGFLLPSGMKEWGLLFFLGVCGFVMQFLLAAALSYEKSSRVTNMTYTQMLFAIAFEKLAFGHTPGILSIIGSSLILGSAIVVAFQRNSNDTKEQTVGSGGRNDEEAQRGLMTDVEPSGGFEQMSLQEAQVRTSR
ncbi:putative membrane protein [Cercospora beticola]|uniref:Putative membrane protein n=2 Tax=Cercospora beticola TaxID=122368 RepID=A0A2G5HNC7_CERBT|nr:putative membrane protein [Cercospora beticola]PIA93723.1 putative membrane protein [Cercospora beticola]WPB02393.1 hypothetical protein RHO25_007027 [Cercospora beticola]CAK1362720.1 unnamed protein product [Cercospora beticola]